MAETVAAAVVAKAVRLIELAEQLEEKAAAARAEALEVLQGGEGIGAKMARVRDAFASQWTARYRSPYVWKLDQDPPNIKRLCKELGPDEVIKRIGVYLRTDSDTLVRQERHPFRFFVSGINSYAPEAPPLDFTEADEIQVADCKHRPRCRTDQEHTARRRAERAS